MHELSLCRAIADSALEHADGRTVERINLQIGHLRQVIPETLQYCWTIQQKDSELANTSLEIEYVAATVECGDCGHTTTLTQPVLRCGSCDSITVQIKTGEEFLIVSIDLTPNATAQEVH